jgi:hypothetical protein
MKENTYWFDKGHGLVYYKVKQQESDEYLCEAFETCHKDYRMGLIEEMVEKDDFNYMVEVTEGEYNRAKLIKDNLEPEIEIIYIGED